MTFDAATQGGGLNPGDESSSSLDAVKTASAAGARPTVSHMLRELTWLLSQSPTHKHLPIADLEWIVMPAILLEQFCVFHGEEHPLGFAVWAYLSEAAEARLINAVETGAALRLRSDEWKSGDSLWLIEVVAPFAKPENKLVDAMIIDLQQGVLRGKKFKFPVVDTATGKRAVQEIGG